LDLFLFFVFWELMLLPMFFLIALWGGPRRAQAALKFFLYTLAGSAPLLLGILALHLHGPKTIIDGQLLPTFDLVELAAWGRRGGFAVAAPIFGIAWTRLVWLALFIGLAVKIPIVPLHTWLPDAHVEAPTPISVILAGILLKTGVYGLVRINFAVLPHESVSLAPLVSTLGALAIVYGALVCLAQKDLKRLIAFSSISHMGFCLLGLGALTQAGLDGAVLNLLTHGLISPMLFLVAGVLYDRAHHRRIDGFGGLASTMPEYATLLSLSFFASLGLPGLCGFVSEFTVFAGSLQPRLVQTLFGATSLVLTAAYYLWALQRVLFGKASEENARLPDVNWRERLTLWPLGLLIVLFGLWPRPLVDGMHASLALLLSQLR
ncbi:MAG: NADH-quinone oxidoreductase subunit M, partial [Deltaproteobacteria bacterium]|nr:NADH-quinone oxidoreductase subunit M [Deltaproteobacteria bacterium]